jgi:hypothetical protein
MEKKSDREFELTHEVGTKVIKFIEENFPELKDDYEDLWGELTNQIVEAKLELERLELEVK